MSLLSEQDTQRIRATIAQVEANTAGEVVVAVVKQSASYHRERYRAAGIWALGTALALALLFPNLTPVYLLALQVPLFLLGLLLTNIRGVTRFLVRAGMRSHVEKRALQLFIERGIHQTRDQSGLLLMLSELEHEVVILGDSGIHHHIGAVGWENYVKRVIQGLHTGEVASAVVDVLKDLGDVLAEHFPARPDDTNELSNSVVVES